MPNFTYLDVSKVADDLVASGHRPNTRNVREALGNQGSYDTINQHLKKWRDSQDKNVAPEIPEAVEESFQKALKSLWNSCYRLLQADMEAIRYAHAQDMAIHNKELQEAFEHLDLKEKEIEILSLKLKESSDANMDYRIELSALKAKLEVYTNPSSKLVDTPVIVNQGSSKKPTQKVVQIS